MISARAMVMGTLVRYIGLNFLRAVAAVFTGIFALVALVDYIETLRRSSGAINASGWMIAKSSFFRVPQVTEQILPFTMLIAAMSCFLTLSRRLELVIARSAGISAWQFVMPAVLVAITVGTFATTVYNPMAATLNEQSKRLELQIDGGSPTSRLQSNNSGFWMRQRSDDGQSIIHAVTSSEQGLRLGGVTAFVYDKAGHFQQRIEAKTATLKEGFWRLDEARVYTLDAAPLESDSFALKTSLAPAQVRESFATPESVPFWDLPAYIETAERAGLGAAGYRLQYEKLLARPFLMAAMVMLAASVSLRFFRFGGVQKMVMGGMLSGFLLFLLSKITDDLSSASLMPTLVAAWLPVLVGWLTGLVALLYQEDG